MSNIYENLRKLNESDQYPFHMPGHKRNGEGNPLADTFDIDITEIDDFDNLHDAKGLILDAEKRCNRLYGSDETFFMVNGSTGGILSAVSAVVKDGDTIAAGRNAHRSFYNAAYINNLKIDYIYPVEKMDSMLCGEIRPETVKEVLESDSNIKAVFITSPTYEGIVSDIAAIADIVHSYNIPLVVDEAHGAHFGFSSFVPDSAVHQGADIVIHSTHKTLPAMTQTALLHVQGNLVDRKRLKRFLKIYQSSSPSYVLIASIDLSMDMLEFHRTEWFERLKDYHDQIIDETAQCKYIKVLGADIIDDPTKIVITCRSGYVSGHDLYDLFRKKYHIQPEMAAVKYVLMIITGNDTLEGIKRLIDAVLDADNSIDILEKENKSYTDHRCNNQSLESVRVPCVQCSSIKAAWDAKSEYVLLEKACGRISADFVNAYPPGVPIIAPGELFSEELTKEIHEKIIQGLNVQGIVLSEDNKYSVKVCKNN